LNIDHELAGLLRKLGIVVSELPITEAEVDRKLHDRALTPDERQQLKDRMLKAGGMRD
jgi:hypothetical protein